MKSNLFSFFVRNRFKALYGVISFLFLISCNSNDYIPYKDSELPVEQRVEDLLGRMTLEEKVGQTLCSTVKRFLAEGQLDTEKLDSVFPYGAGEIRDYLLMDVAPSAQISNEIQKYFIENTRLGIPVIMQGEALHGYVNNGATSFPQASALASTFNLNLIDSVYSVIAREARSRGINQLLSPVVDVVRDPRWGRYSESFGEDPYLVGEIAVQVVKSMQGDASFNDKDHVVATLKHFPGHGTTLGGLNCAPIVATPREMKEVFMYPFEQAIKRAGALSIMASYGEYDGIPTHTNHHLLRDVLRDQWGFEGIVVSDYFALPLLCTGWQWEFYRHFVAADSVDAARLAMNAGVNIELVENECYPHLVELVKQGKVSEKVLDEAVREILRLKFRLGLFEDPYVDVKEAVKIAEMKSSDELALEAARQAVIMLKNEHDILPLKPGQYKKIAVIGPNADKVILGDYSTENPKYFVTVKEGIEKRAKKDFWVSYAEGCKITPGIPGNESKLNEDRKMIKKAVRVAAKSDVVVLVIGTDRSVDKEGRDRSDIQLVGKQEELINEICDLGKPVILSVFGGKVYAIPSIYDKVDGILQCWNLGQETGNALAEIIFGDYSPGGKLTVSIPISEGHIPAYYNKKPGAYMRDYNFESNPGGAIFPFGFGLSYSEFEITDVKLEKDTISTEDSVKVFCTVKNIGDYDGAEVLQLYVQDMVSSVTRPMKQLKDFEYVYLAKGEEKQVTMELTPEKLSFYNRDMKFMNEPGMFEVKLGSSSRDEDLNNKFFLFVK